MATTTNADTERAPSGRSTPDGYVPGGVAGYIVGECTVLCHECGSDHPDVHEHDDGTEHYDYSYISGMDEWDAPGATCEECHRVLDTNILHYDD